MKFKMVIIIFLITIISFSAYSQNISVIQLNDKINILEKRINELNESYWQDMTEEEKASFEKVNVKLQEHDELVSVLENENNSVTNKKYKFDTIFDQIVLEFLNDRLEFYNKVSDPNINEFIKKKIFEGMLKHMSQARR